MQELAEDEGVECDNYYKGEIQLKNPTVHQGFSFKRRKRLVRARQENLFARMKQFNVLRAIFHHDWERHGSCFISVAIIVQLNMYHGKGNLQKVAYDLTY